MGHQSTMLCGNRCDSAFVITIAKQLLDWDDMVLLLELEFILYSENIYEWKSNPYHFSYAQEYEETSTKGRQELEAEMRCNGYFDQLGCHYTITVKEYEWRCYYDDVVYPDHKWWWGGYYAGNDIQFKQTRCGAHMHHTTCQYGQCVRDFCDDAFGPKGAQSFMFDDDICQNTAEGWPRQNAARERADILDESLWKLRMDTFAHVEGYFRAGYIMPFWWYEQHRKGSFVFTHDLIYNMACELCKRRPNNKKCSERCIQESWFQQREIGDERDDGYRKHINELIDDPCSSHYGKHFVICEIKSRRRLAEIASKKRGHSHLNRSKKFGASEKGSNSHATDHMAETIRSLKEALSKTEQEIEYRNSEGQKDDQNDGVTTQDDKTTKRSDNMDIGKTRRLL